ncbi:hypothetical protein FHT87_004145 [Rhizobium sp. BK316]|uniref:hypothetical protein n=1 Tax=Rhizobium sp. BK316 TaxID=2587053 RepID=UPI00161408C2|nr:hypothetical protein [Rhizobium sp. BK316]MBB3410213.1 hypothetical protein [Rhizobium sp. BK316]
MALSREWIELARSIPSLLQIAMRIGVAQAKLNEGQRDRLPFIKFSPQMATAFEAAYCGARRGGLNE